MYVGDDPYDEFTESELEVIDMTREKKKFASNMFGSDFDLKHITDDKEETMRLLQEKSFTGLYLRLQFWINQICKSLHGNAKDGADGEEKPILEVHPVHRTVM